MTRTKIAQSVKRHIGVIGAFSYSGANFILAFLLQASVNSFEFGLYAFGLVLLQFGTGISNALFASTIVVWLNKPATNKVSDVSAHGTVLRDCVVECLRFIFTPIGVEDDEETCDDEGACRAGR